jgi:hypothetical protein
MTVLIACIYGFKYFFVFLERAKAHRNAGEEKGLPAGMGYETAGEYEPAVAEMPAEFTDSDITGEELAAVLAAISVAEAVAAGGKGFVVRRIRKRV